MSPARGRSLWRAGTLQRSEGHVARCLEPDRVMVDPEADHVDPAAPRVQAPIGSRRLIRSGAFIFTMTRSAGSPRRDDNRRLAPAVRSATSGRTPSASRLVRSSPYRRPRVGPRSRRARSPPEMRIAWRPIVGSAFVVKSLLSWFGHCRGGCNGCVYDGELQRVALIGVDDCARHLAHEVRGWCCRLGFAWSG